MEISVGKIPPPWVNDPDLVRAEDSAKNHQIISAVQAANRAELLGEGSELAFRFDREMHRQVIEVRDRATNEVIRQIPPEYLLRVMQSILSEESRDSLE